METITQQSHKQFKWAFLLSSTSVIFGMLREFLIVFLFGFTAKNDHLQLYLSIFYTIGLSVDPMRLACLNLFSVMSLSKMMLAASVIVFPFALTIALLLSYSTGNDLNPALLLVTIVGSYLNLMAVLLITYQQRSNGFLLAQLIHIIPNIILIPGIIFCYLFFPAHLILFIICLTSLIPFLQCTLLLTLFNKKTAQPNKKITLTAALIVLVRHFSASIGEQAFQIIVRSAFFNYAAGYLSMYAFGIRMYAAARFVLIDSYIVSKLSNWQHEKSIIDHYLSKLINLISFNTVIFASLFLISIFSIHNIYFSFLQMLIIIGSGFYFSTLARVSYFKINHYTSHSPLVTRFAMFECITALLAYIVAQQHHYPIFVLLWMGYIAKPFLQLLMLRKKYLSLEYVIRSA